MLSGTEIQSVITDICEYKYRDIEIGSHSVEDSGALSEQRFPHIVIAGSCLVTGGKILHHLKPEVPNCKRVLMASKYTVNGSRRGLK